MKMCRYVYSSVTSFSPVRGLINQRRKKVSLLLCRLPFLMAVFSVAVSGVAFEAVCLVEEQCRYGKSYWDGR